MNKILVIDDEDWLREMVQLALEQKGFEVVQAESGAVGIELARNQLPDLILCDVNMAKMDGYGTLTSLRADPATAAIPFILMTGLADNAGMRHGMELGADDYLPKPFTLEGLYGAVEARLRKLQTVRQEAEKKLAELRDNISLMLPHELRTPLNGILAYGQILSTDAPSLQPPEVAEMGKDIYESGKRLERLIENFLIYAQLELLATDSAKIAALGGKCSEHAAALVEEHARAQARAANRPADLVLSVADGSLAIAEDYLAKIVNELVQNAFKFSPGGTVVRVGMTDFPDFMVLTISDSGRGLSTEHVNRVGAYMQFERKMHEQQGIGLGLSIAKRLIELHRGSLTIQSKRGVSTSMTVKLPKATEPSLRPDVAA